MTGRWGAWTIDAAIADGAVAEVVAAHGPDGAAVALKRLHPHAARDVDLRALFAREQAAACDVPPHPRLATGVAHGEHAGVPWLAMRLAPGVDLRRHAAPPPAARQVVADAADALAHLHAFGLVHGDVNPGNLVVDDAGRAVLCDLGVARAPGEPGPVRGTHAYMAPEQVRGEAWTPAVDVFALGVVLWELTTGARLFHRGAAYLSMAAVMAGEAPPLADAALDALVRRALAPAAAARPSLADFTMVASGKP